MFISYIFSLLIAKQRRQEEHYIKVIGSYNSYKIGIEKPLLSYLAEVNSASKSLEYEHIPLTD